MLICAISIINIIIIIPSLLTSLVPNSVQFAFLFTLLTTIQLGELRLSSLCYAGMTTFGMSLRLLQQRFAKNGTCSFDWISEPVQSFHKHTDNLLKQILESIATLSPVPPPFTLEDKFTGYSLGCIPFLNCSLIGSEVLKLTIILFFYFCRSSSSQVS